MLMYRKIINEIAGDISVEVNRNAGNASEDITFDHKNIINVNNQSVTAACGLTNEVRIKKQQQQLLLL